MMLAGIIGYVLLQFAIGVWVSRRIKTDTDYILAGRTLGTLLVAFPVFATWFGAEAIVAASGAVYENGLSGAWIDPIGYGSAVVIIGALYAALLWRKGVTTFADVFRQRFSPAIEKLVVVVLLPGSVFWAAAQVRAFGQILSSSSQFDLVTAITIAALLIAGYSVIGGLLADAVTDLIQGSVVIVGLVILAIAVVMSAGGFNEAVQGLPPERFDVTSAPRDDFLVWLEDMAVAILGSIVAIELISRFLGARSAEVARAGTIIGGLMYLGIGLFPVFLGMAGAALAIKDPTFAASIPDPEQIVAALSEYFLPTWHHVLFAGAMVSAILSVTHSALHSSAAQVSHNLVVKMLPSISAQGKLWSARLTVIVLTAAASGLALTSDGIKELVSTASAFGSAGVFVTAMFALFTRFGGPLSAGVSILLGVAVWAAGKFMLELDTPYMIAVAASFVGYVGAALIERQAGAKTVTETPAAS